MNYAVIMAGGSGTRFWPMSTQERPKQFLKLFGDRTMLQTSVERLDGFIPLERCMILANEQHLDLIREQLPGLPPSLLVGEPVARNTAPCIALAARLLLERDPDAVMVVLTADHRIEDEEAFRSILRAAVETARNEECLVTLGIRPNRPETGYGYIRYRNEAVRAGDHESFPVLNFTEKPDRETAESFLKSGDYLWNSGMFIWKASVILEEFRKHLPEIYHNAERFMESSAVAAGGSADSTPEKIREESIPQASVVPDREELLDYYRSCPAISIDYGIMEKAEKVRVLPGDFGWSDVGSWQAVHEMSLTDEKGNSIRTPASILEDSAGNLIQSESGKLIALVGVENLAIVETENAILVCDLNRSQDVRKVVEELKREPSLRRFL